MENFFEKFAIFIQAFRIFAKIDHFEQNLKFPLCNIAKNLLKLHFYSRIEINLKPEVPDKPETLKPEPEQFYFCQTRLSPNPNFMKMANPNPKFSGPDPALVRKRKASF